MTLRLADSADHPALRRLAQLDSRSLPTGPHLVAVRAGRIDAAVSLATGELVADPFRRTAELARLLRCHAGEPPVAAREDRSGVLALRSAVAPA